MQDNDKLHSLPLLMRDIAADWFDNLANNSTETYEHFVQAFRAYFIEEAVVPMSNANKLWTRTQGANETVKDFTVSFTVTKKTGYVLISLRFRKASPGLNTHAQS
jgi:hypothetical protein